MTSCQYIYFLTIRGVILDAQTNEPIADAPVGATIIIEGQIVGQEPAVDENGLPVGVPSDAIGAFALTVTTDMKLARPDRVQLIIVRDGCERRIMVEINEDTAQFVDDEDGPAMLEFTGAILVPPCEQPP
jgi:hypothetical protein